jgi:hypothetical protein
LVVSAEEAEEEEDEEEEEEDEGEGDCRTFDALLINVVTEAINAAK